MQSAQAQCAAHDDVEDRIRGMLAVVASPKSSRADGVSLAMNSSSRPGSPNDALDEDAQGWGQESYEPAADSVEALGEESKFATVRSKFCEAPLVAAAWAQSRIR
jgi:hypothetical protein